MTVAETNVIKMLLIITVHNYRLKIKRDVN